MSSINAIRRIYIVRNALYKGRISAETRRLNGLSHEIDFKNFGKNLQNLA